MDTCVHCLEYKADVCLEELKYVKEQGNLDGFQLRLLANGEINDKYSQLNGIANSFC